MYNTSNQINMTNVRLAWMLAKRDLKNRYASSYAGAAWNVGVPLLYALTNIIVFSILMKGRMGSNYSDVPFALFYLLPFSLWTIFAEVTSRSTSILREYSYLINKIAFPVWILPLVPFASALLGQAIILIFISGLMFLQGIVPANTASIFFLVWFIALILTIGAAYAVSAISVYIPDMGQLVPVVVNILFWLTPLLYPATIVEKSEWVWVRNIVMDYNPFYYIVESARLAVFGTGYFEWSYLGFAALAATLFFVVGVWIFRKLQPGFADIV